MCFSLNSVLPPPCLPTSHPAQARYEKEKAAYEGGAPAKKAAPKKSKKVGRAGVGAGQVWPDRRGRQQCMRRLCEQLGEAARG